MTEYVWWIIGYFSRDRIWSRGYILTIINTIGHYLTSRVFMSLEIFRGASDADNPLSDQDPNPKLEDLTRELFWKTCRYRSETDYVWIQCSIWNN